MNRTQILSSLLGILLVVSGCLYYMGHWNTSWEQYRVELTEAMNESFKEEKAPDEAYKGIDCVIDGIVSILKDSACPIPGAFGDPIRMAGECIMYDPLAKIMFASVIVTCVPEGE